MSTVIDLDGPGWLMREALGETWRWYVDQGGAEALPALNNAAEAARAVAAGPGWIPARVPGSVVTSLALAGEIPDPYRGRNSRAAEWTGSRSWVFRCAVELPGSANVDEVVVELDGVDPAGTVFWDGEPIGEVEGLYHRLCARVPREFATPGPHRLAVVVRPVPHNEPQVGHTRRVRVHRPRLNEGWDFSPRMPHQGLWRSARVIVGATHIAGLTLQPTLTAGGEGTIEVSAQLTGADVPLEITAYDRAGQVAASVTTPTGERSGAGWVRAALTIDRPELWWPHRLGEPAIYTVELRCGGASARRVTGFRTASLEPNAGAPAGALGYTAVINGSPVPLIGWNWAPADTQHGAVTRERLAHLLTLARDSGAQLLRVWGGGLVESEDFYELCDRAGLLVWQEFSQSSSGIQSAPATDRDFVGTMRHEARLLVSARAHHPSLLLWGGGNELDLDGVPLDEERSPVLAALRDEVRRLDPGRGWLPTSPSGPAFHHRADVIAAAPEGQHDVHGPWEHQGLEGQHALADSGTCLAHTEFGVEGMANRRQLEYLVPEENRWPADRSNPVYQHLGEWWNNAELVQESFGARLTDIEQLRRASQHLQAAGLGYAVEADRRRWPRCSMVLPWQLAESYPNAWCTAVVDHLGDVKPAYHAVTRAFDADRVTLRTRTTAWGGHQSARAEAWVWSVDGVPAGSSLELRLRSAEGSLLGERRWTLDGGVGWPRAVGEFEVPAGELPRAAVLLWEARWTAPDGLEIDREVAVATSAADLAPLLDLPRAELAVRWQDEREEAVEITHLSGAAAIGLELRDARPAGVSGWAVLGGDPRPLLPEEVRRLAVTWRGGAPGPVRIEAWNAGPLTLAPTDH